MESLLLTITNVLELSIPQQPQQAFWWWLIPCFIIIISDLIPDTKNVVILGHKASGKTTLWNQLRGLEIANSYESTSKEEIKSFDITTKTGRTRTIWDSYDIGGDDQWVADYDKLIKEDYTFIFFLVDLTNAKKKKDEIRARLLKIVKIIEYKKLKECGITIVGTFYDKYRISCADNADNADTYLKKLLDLNSISKRLKDVQFIHVNLLDSDDIEKIKEEITK